MKTIEMSRSSRGPERTCLGCRGRFAKGELLRFVVRAGVLLVDQTVKLPGRGAYCCRREGCLVKFSARKGSLTKALRQEVVDCRVVMTICVDGFGSAPGRGDKLADNCF